jgi:intein/homing endonuclease
MQKVVRAKHHSVILFKNSKAIHTFITNEFKIPARKHDIQIPDKIKSSNKDCKAAFLRGLFDADGCIVIKSKPNKYPVVQFASKSQLLIDQVSLLLLELGVESCKYKESHFDKRTNKTYTIYHTHINGRKRVSAFMQNVGFSNINKTKKYEDFQEAK